MDPVQRTLAASKRLCSSKIAKGEPQADSSSTSKRKEEEEAEAEAEEETKRKKANQKGDIKHHDSARGNVW